MGVSVIDKLRKMVNWFDFEGAHGTWPPVTVSNLCFLWDAHNSA